jgi:anaerobic selenocysteine-containing dehydrogenase
VTATDKRSFCRFCPSACGVVVTVEGDRVLHVRPDLEHPASHGYTCPKGRALGAWHHDPRRLDAPVVRRDGQAVTVGWDECLDDLAGALSAIVGTNPAGLGFFKGTGASFDSAGLFALRRLSAAVGSPSYYSTMTVDCASLPLVAELVAGNGALLPAPSSEASLVVLVGVNPMVSHGHSSYYPMPKTHLRSWAEGGGLWVVDPRRTETAELATRHLAPRPGTDHALLGFLVRELLRDGSDAEYVASSVAGADELRAAVEPFELAVAARTTALPEQDLVDLLAAVRRAGRVAIQVGTGVTMAASANVTVWLAWAVNAITGSLDRPGGMWFNPGGTRRLDEKSWTPRDGTPLPGPPSRPELPLRHGEYPSAAIADEIETGGLRAMVVLGGNLVTALPNASKVRAALKRLDALVVLDVVETGTTELATHVLPCTGQLERADVTLLDWLLPQVSAQYTPAVVPAGALRRPVWWILAELGRRMGIDVLPADTETDEDVLARVVAAGGAGVWSETTGNGGDAAGGEGGLFAELRASTDGTVVVGGETFGWVHRSLPGGRWRIAPPVLVEQLASLSVPAASRLTLISGRQLGRMNSQTPAVAGAARGADGPGVRVHPDTAAELGLAVGRPAEITSPYGRLVADVHFDEGLRKDTVWCPHGFVDMNVSGLTSDRDAVDPVSGMVTQTAIPVELRPV